MILNLENGGFEKCPFITINGHADFDRSSITSLEGLKRIEGRAWFELSQITDIGQLESIGGYADFGNLKDLKKQWEERQRELKEQKKLTGQDIGKLGIPKESDCNYANKVLNGLVEEKGEESIGDE